MSEPYRKGMGAWLGYVAIRTLLFLLRLMPLRLSAFVAGWLSRAVFLFVPARRRMAREEMQRALGDEYEEALPAANLAHFGVMGAEMAHLSTIARHAREWSQLKDQHHYEEAAQKGGVILLSGHIGNWEILGLGHAQHFGPVAALVKRIHNGWLDRWIVAQRQRLGVRSIVASGTVHEVVRYLKEGGTLALLMDQNTMENEAVWVPFLGKMAATQAGVAMLAARSGAIVVPTVGYRTAPGHFCIQYLPPVPMPGRDKPLRYRVYHGTLAFAAAVEAMVRAHPEQWLWLHKRWKTQPRDETDPWRVGNIDLPVSQEEKKL